MVISVDLLHSTEGTVTASFAEQEIWHVMVASDDMKRMNVDQLDDAFRLDIVDSSTLVWKDGMQSWRRLGSIAGIDDDDDDDDELEILDYDEDDDDEPQTVARFVAPPRALTAPVPSRTLTVPTPPPPPRPRPQPRSLTPQQPNPFLTGVNPFAATAPAGSREAPRRVAPVYTQPLRAPVHTQPLAPVYTQPLVAPVYTQPLVAPVYTQPLVAPVRTQPLRAPDLYVLPQRRGTVPSEVDFRRSSGSRWGRWLVALSLLTAGVLAAYRQDYLRAGARRVGLENKYVHAERRVTGWLTDNAPSAVKAALTQLALLPGPNAPLSTALSRPSDPAPRAATPATPAVAPASAPPKAPSSDVKTVSLDSLPVLGSEPAAPATPATLATPAARARDAGSTESSPKVVTKASRKEPAVEPKPVARVAKAVRRETSEEPVAKTVKKEAAEPEAKPKATKAPPPAMNTPLKAAIWQAMQADAKKKK